MSLPNCVEFNKISGELDGKETPVHVCEKCNGHINSYDDYYNIDGEIMCKECGEDFLKEKYLFRAGV